MKHLRARKRQLTEVKLEPPKTELKHRRLTLELIDKMLDLYREEPGDANWDKFMELFWGKADEEAIILELLTLARVALVHLNLASDVLACEERTDGCELSEAPGPNQVSRAGESTGSTSADENNQGLHALDTSDLPSRPPGKN